MRISESFDFAEVDGQVDAKLVEWELTESNGRGLERVRKAFGVLVQMKEP
jgi:hypothetical protein